MGLKKIEAEYRDTNKQLKKKYFERIGNPKCLGTKKENSVLLKSDPIWGLKVAWF